MTPPVPDEAQWFCVHTQAKRERLAAGHIVTHCGLEVFCPRITFRKRTRAGLRRFTEALFPGYIFVRCENQECFRHLLSMRGVVRIVHFGAHYPAMSQRLIEELRETLGGEELEAPEPEVLPGSRVLIVEGPFSSFTAKVCACDKARERVSMLLDFLGRDLEVTLPVQAVMAHQTPP